VGELVVLSKSEKEVGLLLLLLAVRVGLKQQELHATRAQHAPYPGQAPSRQLFDGLCADPFGHEVVHHRKGLVSA
jgi:hypothetical protein